ncbi:MAG TPA: hypothetical protein PLP28_13610, partial [Flavobacteriales bacterium]|nr:hypothetical protein [Flavobacteriales bacterium]
MPHHHMITIRNDGTVRIELDLEHGKVTSTWSHSIRSEEYRLALWHIHDLVRDHHLVLWLSDTRAMGAILHADEKWSIEVFMPEVIKLGLRRVAVVRSEDYFAHTATARMVDATAVVAPFKVELFADAGDAEDWLLKE